MSWLAIDDHGEQWAVEHTENLILTNQNTGLSDPLVLEQLRSKLRASDADS
jgi:hypothetical protein